MDSMRHLSTSLPSTRRVVQTQELLADFKAAALSVTNLYKSAASAQVKARAAGYQDALDDLLTFLDHENLGLMDGEGWRVRQWATERLDDGVPRQPSSDDEDEPLRDENLDTRSSSPEAQRKPLTSQATIEDASSTHRRVASEPPQPQTTQSTTQPATQAVAAEPSTTPDVPSGDFTFRSSATYPSVQERDLNPMEVDGSTEPLRPVPRSKTRSNHTRARGDARSVINFNLGTGAGNKRKIPYPDFFDISGLNFDSPEKRDGSGRGGKKGRFV